MVDPVRHDRHGNGDRNDNDVAKRDQPGQEERDRKIREAEKDIEEESRRNTGSG